MSRITSYSKKLHAMKIGEVLKSYRPFYIYRVPGGWLYEAGHSAVFVPLTDEGRDIWSWERDKTNKEGE